MINKISNSEQTAIRSIHYLGSKLRMLESIKNAVDSVECGNGLICDLFSGSGTVSKYLLQYRDVIAVDIQTYSKVICEASMSSLKQPITSDTIINSIKKSTATATIKEVFFPLLTHEQECTNLAMQNDLKMLYEIIENGSLYIYMHDETPKVSQKLKNALSSACERMKKYSMSKSQDTMITRYYGGLYFSFEQAVELDCIAHEVFQNDGLLKTKMLAALLSTASELVNTVGKQFAQPLKVRNAKGELKASLKNKILSDRSENAIGAYKKWLDYYLSTGLYNHKCNSLCMNYTEALESLKGSGVKVVYADPPYTRYHYSRYYHVLETICLRDNPTVSTTFSNGAGGISRAIYRSERHQSPFCIKSQAEHAFELLFQGVKNLDVPFVLSYSPFEPSKAVTPRLQTMDQLIEMAHRYYDHIDVVSPGTFTHSKLNSVDKNFEANHEAERLIICR